MRVFVRWVVLCVAVFAFLEGGVADAQVTGLAFRPIDAAYSRALDRVVLISANPDQLHIYDPASHADRTVALPGTPLSFSLSGDETHAAVAFANSVIYVDLKTAAVTNTYSNISVGNGKLVAASGYIYIFPSYPGSLLSIEIATGQTVTDAGLFYSLSGAAFDAAVNGVYALFLNQLTHFDASGGVIGTQTNQTSYYFGTFRLCDPLWFSRDGATIYSGCGSIYRASTDSVTDMRYLGSLPDVTNVQGLDTSDTLNRIAAIPTIPFTAMPPEVNADTVVNIYSASTLNPAGKFRTTPFQVGVNYFAAHARRVFYNSTSTAMYIITQADPNAGLQFDYAIERVDLTSANSCKATFDDNSRSVEAAGSYATAQILSSTACTFQAVSNAPWIVLSAGFYGSGDTTLTYLVRPNLSAASRSGTISLGSEMFTVYQDGAGAASPLNPLSFKPVAADYDKTLDKIVMVSAGPNELHIYDAATYADQIVPLTYIPLSVSVAPDGLTAAVGHRGHVSIVDLRQLTVTQTLAIDSDAGAILLAGNGYVYSFPPMVSSGTINSIELATGTVSRMQNLYYGTIPRLDASGNYLYVSGSYGGAKLDISNGPAKLVQSGLTTSAFGNIWLTEDGNRLISSNGNVFFTSANPSQDLQPDGKLSAPGLVDWAADSSLQQQIAVLTDFNNTRPTNARLQIYGSQGLSLKSDVAMPSFSNSSTDYASHGRYLFWNAAETKLFAVIQADSTSGLLSDFAVYTVAAPEALPTCSYAVSPTSINASPGYSSWIINVISNCAWSPNTSGSNWIGTSVYGGMEGSGQLPIWLGANSGAARSGTVVIGNQKITINQADASCTYTLSPNSITLPEIGGTRAVGLTTGAGCPWSVQSNQSWVTVQSSLSGTGPAVIRFSVAPAQTSPVYQYGYLNIAGLNFSIQQRTDRRAIPFAVWRPSNGTWFVLDAQATYTYPVPTVLQQWGLPGDIPVPADYDGDGRIDFAAWRPSEGMWYVIPSSSPLSPSKHQWGLPGDIPVPGDFNGDGYSDFAVWRPSNGTWYVSYSNAPTAYPVPDIQRQWGLKNDIPLIGDFNGDGKADFTVWRPSEGSWYVSFNTGASAYPIPDIRHQWGLPGDIPLIGDFNGDGKADFTVWRPLEGMWYVSYSSGTTSYPVPDLKRQWGLPGDVPLVGDFNGDGRLDFVIWRPSNGTWYISYTGATSYPAPDVQQQWGLPGDVPVQMH